MSENDFTPIPDGSKKCKDCGQVKLLTEFCKRPSNADGHDLRCRYCYSIYRGRTPKSPKPTVRDLGDTIEIPLTKGHIAVVDKIDADLAEIDWTSLETEWVVYAYRSSETRVYPGLLHRIILERAIGRSLSSKEKVDHANGNGLDNRRGNLRLATNAQNSQNVKVHQDSRSGLKGVSFSKSHNRWQARICVNRKQIHLGYFIAPEDAHAAYCEAAKRFFGEFARTK